MSSAGVPKSLWHSLHGRTAPLITPSFVLVSGLRHCPGAIDPAAPAALHPPESLCSAMQMQASKSDRERWANRRQNQRCARCSRNSWLGLRWRHRCRCRRAGSGAGGWASVASAAAVAAGVVVVVGPIALIRSYFLGAAARCGAPPCSPFSKLISSIHVELPNGTHSRHVCRTLRRMHLVALAAGSPLLLIHVQCMQVPPAIPELRHALPVHPCHQRRLMAFEAQLVHVHRERRVERARIFLRQQVVHLARRRVVTRRALPVTDRTVLIGVVRQQQRHVCQRLAFGRFQRLVVALWHVCGCVVRCKPASFEACGSWHEEHPPSSVTAPCTTVCARRDLVELVLVA